MAAMETKRLALLGLLVVTLIILIFIFFQSTGSERIKKASTVSLPESGGLKVNSQQTKSTKLFFLSEEDSMLHSEEREIVDSPSLVNQAKQVIEELLKGSQNNAVSPFPPETKLREIYFTEEGIAYVDFSKEIQERHPSGSMAEIATVYSVVNSLTYNFKSIKRVFILIDGGEKETLGGHIDLSRPLLPYYDLIAN